jgi:hypothetical protein
MGTDNGRRRLPAAFFVCRLLLPAAIFILSLYRCVYLDTEFIPERIAS